MWSLMISSHPLLLRASQATVEITSRFDGKIVSLHFEVGEIAPTGSALVDIDTEDAADEGEAAPAPAAAEPEAPKAAAPAAAATSAARAPPHRGADGKVLATPAVRRIARENDISLEDVPGTGKAGRVLKEDILAFISGGVGGPAAAAPDVKASLPPPPVVPLASATAEDTVVEPRGLQRAMIKSMTAAWAQPHFGFYDEVNIDELVRARAAVKAAVADRGINVTYMPFFMKAASQALRSFPNLNAHVNADASEVIYRGSHNIGFAVDSPRGLIVPNIKNVQALSLLEVAQEMNRLTALAAEGKLGEEDLTGGTFTISNVGMIGGTYTSPVLVPGTVAIAALGAIRKVPAFDEHDNVVPARVVNVSWSADHRVIDGATMARFHSQWIGYLQNPALLAAELR